MKTNTVDGGLMYVIRQRFANIVDNRDHREVTEMNESQIQCLKTEVEKLKKTIDRLKNRIVKLTPQEPAKRKLKKKK